MLLSDQTTSYQESNEQLLHKRPRQTRENTITSIESTLN